MKKSKIILLLSVILVIACVFAAGCSKKFAVTFNGNGGTLVSGTEVQQVKDAEEIVPPVYEKEGYALSWDTEISKIDKETTVTAVWTAKEYKVNFVLNATDAILEGGTLVKYTYDEVMELPIPERAGYTFGGWKKDSVEGEALVSGSIFKYTADFSAYAVWSANTYSVTFELNDASQSPATMEGAKTINYVYDAQMSLPIPTRLGYIFAGWKKGDVNGEALTQNQVNKYAESFTAYATWEIDDGATFAITLDLAGGNYAGAVNPTTYKTSDEDITLVNPVRAGFRFVGWKAGAGEPNKNVTIIACSAGDKAFTAVWEQITYTIDFYLVGADDKGNPRQLTIDGANDIANVTIAAEESLGKLLPTKKDFDAVSAYEGFAFDYWKVTVNGKTVVVDANFVFSAEEFGEADITIEVAVVLVSVWSNIH